MRRIRTGLVAGTVVLTLTGAVAGCSSSSEEEDDGPIEGAQTEAPPTEENEGEEADVAALEDVYRQYWDVLVQLENSTGELDPSLFDGVADTAAAEYELSRMNSYKSHGFYREGEPELSNITVEADGDSARVEACVNEANWPMLDRQGEVVDDPAFDDLDVPHPNVVEATRADGEWLISRVLELEESTISC